MKLSFLVPYIARIAELSLENGGFGNHQSGKYRPDITAWAILILNAFSPHSHAELIKLARTRLTHDQLPNGSVVISPDHQEAIWPTPLSIFAWHGSSPHLVNQKQAVLFLLQRTGLHMEKTDGNSVVGHDTSIPGWPWILETHSWVQPTALCMIALSINGHESHQRVNQGEQMLMNRQLPQGGWNYGNTTILGKELQPFPESTGIALSALAGRVPQTAIDKSLNYLLHALPQLRTPISLSWGVLGLQAWNRAPRQAETWLLDCLKNESRYGQYDPVSLCLLLAAITAHHGLTDLVTTNEPQQAMA